MPKSMDVPRTIANIHLGTGANVHYVGKSRKERHTPLTAHIVDILTP